MAHIPIGYIIRGGKAAIDPEAAEKVRRLFDGYISGLSITKAKEAAGLDVCVRTANSMLERRLYLGDGYYPPIIDEETFEQAAAVRRERLEAHRRGATKPKPAAEPGDRFILAALPERPEGITDAEAVSLLYSCIAASPEGRKEASAEERSRIRAWLGMKR